VEPLCRVKPHESLHGGERLRRRCVELAVARSLGERDRLCDLDPVVEVPAARREERQHRYPTERRQPERPFGHPKRPIEQLGVERPCTGRHAVELESDQPALPEVPEHGQGVEGAIADGEDGHAVPAADLVMEGLGVGVLFALHDDGDARLQVSREKPRGDIPRTDMAGDQDRPATARHDGPQPVTPGHDDPSLGRVATLGTQGLRKARGVVRERAHHVPPLGERGARPLNGTKVVADLFAKVPEGKRKERPEQRRGIADERRRPVPRTEERKPAPSCAKVRARGVVVTGSVDGGYPHHPSSRRQAAQADGKKRGRNVRSCPVAPRPPTKDRALFGAADGASVAATTLLSGELSLLQPADGFRITVDALLLAAFASRGRAARLVVDLGAGTGVIALALHHVGAAKEVVLVEREPELVALGRKNLALAGAQGRVERADLATLGLPPGLAQRAELVVSNPPFFGPPATRPRRDPKARRARSGELAPFVKAAARALTGPSGRACFVYAAPGLPHLLELATEVRLVPKRLRFVHASATRAARVVLVELRLAKPGGLVIEPPLVEWSKPGRRSKELENVVAGRFGPRGVRAG